MIYYPVPLHQQEAFKGVGRKIGTLELTEQLCSDILSLPMHTELTEEVQLAISNTIKDFFKR
jgi:dTDP-4-amino-4,6-dideoxygalactose transaminase